MSFNIRDYVSDDHIESISEIATGQASIIQALSLDNSQKDKKIERLNNIINELEKYMNENYIYDDVGMKIFDASVLQDKLQELKGVDKE